MDTTYQEILKQLVSENNIAKINPDDIKIVKRIGDGSQSNVFLADYLGKAVALKQLLQFDIKCIIHEIAILSKLEHKYIPKFMGIVIDEKEQKICYVTEFIKGNPLDEVDVNKLSHEVKIRMLKQLSDIINFVHANNCVHRDLKAENIMVDTNLNVFFD